jgi:hypothetical protein
MAKIVGTPATRIDLEPVMRLWAQETAQRNAVSLLAGAGPDGPPLAPLKRETVKAKAGRTSPGVATGQMLAGLTSPGVIRRRSASRYQVLGAAPGKGGQDAKVNFFVQGRSTAARTGKAIRRAAKAAGTTVKKQRIKAGASKVPGRDFFGHDPAVVDRALERAAVKSLNDLGFR